MRKAFIAAILCAAGAMAGDVVVEKYAPQPYKFGYESQDEWGNAQSRHEQDLGDGTKTGSYGYRDALGVFRHVNYVADHAGFRAWVKTNEPGTADSAPAAVKIEKQAEQVIVGQASSAAVPIAAYAAPPPTRVLVAPKLAASAVVRPPVYAGHAPIVTGTFASKFGGYPVIANVPRFATRLSHNSGSVPLALAASSQVASVPVVQPVPVRKLVGPSAAAFVAPVAPITTRLTTSANVVSRSPIVSSGGLHTASSEAILVAPTLAVAPGPVLSLQSRVRQNKRPYDRFAESFRRRRPIKTIGDKELYLPPMSLTAGGVPIYKDK